MNLSLSLIKKLNCDQCPETQILLLEKVISYSVSSYHICSETQLLSNFLSSLNYNLNIHIMTDKEHDSVPTMITETNFTQSFADCYETCFAQLDKK